MTTPPIPVDHPGEDGPPVLFDEQAIIAAVDARAAADLAAGRVIGHSAVRHWLGCWGSDVPLAPTPWPG